MDPGLRLRFAGHPRPYARAGRNGRFTYTPPLLREWMESCAAQTREQLPPEWSMLRADNLVVVARMTFRFPLTKKGRQRVIRSDADNLGKSILDALQGVVWEDDVIVRAPLPIVLFGGGEPGVDVRVVWMDEDRWVEAGAALVDVIDAAMLIIARGA